MLPLTQGFIAPCIPTRSTQVPEGPDWIHVIKHDGYRILVRRNGARVRLFTRNGYDWSDRYPLIVEAVGRLRVRSVALDGEAVIWGENGAADFDQLHARGCDELVIMVAFDLLEVDGDDLRHEPLERRKARLRKLLARASDEIRFNEHLEVDGAAVFEHACRLGLEGIVSKRWDFPYRSGPHK